VKDEGQQVCLNAGSFLEPQNSMMVPRNFRNSRVKRRCQINSYGLNLQSEQ